MRLLLMLLLLMLMLLLPHNKSILSFSNTLQLHRCRRLSTTPIDSRFTTSTYTEICLTATVARSSGNENKCLEKYTMSGL